MGNSNTHSISYRTKDDIRISYIFWDLKGKNRFPDPPGDTQINFMLQRCLQDIDASEQQIKAIKQFNSKYKYRFVILHKRKVAQGKKQRQLQDLKRSSVQIHQTQFVKVTDQKNKVFELQQLMKDVQLNQTLIKVALMKIDKYIAEKYAHNEFLSIRGLERLLQLLQKAIKINASGTKTNFSNQVQLLKFFKFFSDRYPKQFYNYIPRINNYGSVIIKTYHPVNTHIASYCLNLLTDYLWRVQQGEHIIKILECYRLSQNYQSFLSPFAQTINSTDSILMVYYNLKFINQLIASVIEEDKKQLLNQSLNFIKYGYVLDGVKAKLQQNYYTIDNTTFIAMHQKIFKHVTKDKTQKKPIQEARISYRNTLNLNALHEQILLNFLQNDNHVQQDQQNQENGNEQIITAYLAESDRKTFNKFILDTLTELQKYNKLQFYLDNVSKNGQQQQDTQQLVQSKINLQNLQTYFGRIKQSCAKNNCNQILNSSFKNLQYFQKNQWKHLERFILEQLGLQRKITDQIDQMKKNIEEKETIIKRIIKENIDLRNQISDLRNNNSHTERSVGRLQLQASQFLQSKKQQLNQTINEANFSKNKHEKSLPLPPLTSNKSKKLDIPEMPASLSKFLPKSTLLPPPPKKKQVQNNQQMDINISQNLKNSKIEKPMRDKPKLKLQAKTFSLQIYENLSKSKGNQLTQLNNNILLPPPPPINQNTINLGYNSPSLPSIPSIGTGMLPPPPSLGSTLLPPPPSLGNASILPPPPTLSNTSLLPPPPSLGNTSILPPPPSFGLVNLLPPPPSLGQNNLLPPPPIGINNLLPPGPMIGFPLPSGPSTVPNLSFTSIGTFQQVPQKIKEKRKPKNPLKACNYTILSYQKIVSTIFQQIDDTKLTFDQDQLVQMFSKTIPSSNPDNSSQRKVSSVIIAPSIKETVKLLGSDRWRNIEIILTKLRIPRGQIFKTLTQCTGKFTSHSVLQSISKILPTEEEEQMIKSYEGNEDDLGKPQRFLKQIIEVPQYSSRVKAMIFSNIKEEFYYELSSKIQQLTAGFSSLKQNKRLKHVLQVCLGLGNYLNGTTMKGGAWGFKIQTIERLQQIKSNDNKMNAAFYLIKEVWKQYPYPIFDKDQIELYQYLSKMPISQINSQIGQLNIYNKAIEKAYNSNNKNDFTDHIGAYCEQIMMELSVKLQQYKQSSEKLSEIYQESAKFYCEDPKKIVSDQFGKKMFQCILFISNTEKMFKILEDKRLKDESRKALKTQIRYSQGPNPQSNKKQQKSKKQQKKIQLPAQRIQPIKLPDFSKLPPPPPKNINKQQKLKEFQKIQQERQKKALQQVMMRRTSKLQAYRMSKITQTQVNNNKGLEQIDFLKSVR